MRFVLVLVLFQFIAPAFVPTTTQGLVEDKNTYLSYHKEQNSLLFTFLLKEKEEKEDKDEAEEKSINFISIQLLDFSIHTFSLTEFHQHQCEPASFDLRFNHHPPLFTLFSTFII